MRRESKKTRRIVFDIILIIALASWLALADSLESGGNNSWLIFAVMAGSSAAVYFLGKKWYREKKLPMEMFNSENDRA